MFQDACTCMQFMAVKCSQAKCSADLATWVCPVVECQTQLGVPIDLCCSHSMSLPFLSITMSNLHYKRNNNQHISGETFLSQRLSLSTVRSRYLCWWWCWNCAPKWNTQNAYPTGNTQQKTLWPLLALQNHAHFQQSHSVQHESENMDNTTINAEQNHWAV